MTGRSRAFIHSFMKVTWLHYFLLFHNWKHLFGWAKCIFSFIIVMTTTIFSIITKIILLIIASKWIFALPIGDGDDDDLNREISFCRRSRLSDYLRVRRQQLSLLKGGLGCWLWCWCWCWCLNPLQITMMMMMIWWWRGESGPMVHDERP